MTQLIQIGSFAVTLAETAEGFVISAQSCNGFMDFETQHTTEVQSLYFLDYADVQTTGLELIGILENYSMVIQ